MKILLLLLSVFLFWQCTKDENPDKHKLNMEWIRVEGGSFVMGSLPGDVNDNEMPAHNVILSDYYIGKYEVTNTQFADFLNSYNSDTIKKGEFLGEKIMFEFKWGIEKTDSGWRAVKGYESHPVLNISWVGANEFCKYYGWQLPTEAEWEFAALGGNLSKGYIYSGSNSAAEVAWCSPDYEDAPGLYSHPVGIKKANEIGIYDMSGNAWEWVWDYYHYYDSIAQVDPTGRGIGKYHILRGGCWLSTMYNSRTKTRISDEFDYHGITHNGFRCVRK